jgi:Ca2+-binding EF-hand superfamily protein
MSIEGSIDFLQAAAAAAVDNSSFIFSIIGKHVGGPVSYLKTMDKRQMIKAFKEADKNGDGKLDLDEYIGLFRGLGVNLSREDAAVLFKEKDRDNDKLISFIEYTGKITETEKAWNALDANRNGHLTRDEIRAGVKKYKKTLPSIITNQNGENFLKL